MGGEVVGPYRLISLLGRGGMGEAWRAVDTRKDRPVALKLLGAWLGGDEDFAHRFRRESALAAKLNAPNILSVHDYGDIDGRLFLDMPLIDGVDLGGLLERDGPLPPTRAVGIISQVARALGAAHRAGLVHRDVKPSNILITDNEGDDHVYLIDFGIARAVDGTRISQTGAAIGTPAYMAPECFAGDSDHHADIYALGCMLHQSLTAKQPFMATNPLVYMHAHQCSPPPQPSVLRAGVPRAFDDVVAVAMAKDPARRYPSAGDLAAAARAALATHAYSETVDLPDPPPATAAATTWVAARPGATPVDPAARPAPDTRDVAAAPAGPASQPERWARAGDKAALVLLSLPAAVGLLVAAVPRPAPSLAVIMLAIAAAVLRYRAGRSSGDPVFGPSLTAGFAVASTLFWLAPEPDGSVGVAVTLTAVASAAVGLHVAAVIGRRSGEPTTLGRPGAQQRTGDALAASCLSILLIYGVVRLGGLPEAQSARSGAALGVAATLLISFVVVVVVLRALAGARRPPAATLVAAANAGLLCGFPLFVAVVGAGSDSTEDLVAGLIGVSILAVPLLTPIMWWAAGEALRRRTDQGRPPTSPGVLFILVAIAVLGVVAVVITIGIAIVRPAPPVPGSRSGTTAYVTSATPGGPVAAAPTDYNRIDNGASVIVECGDASWLRLSSFVRNSGGYNVPAGYYVPTDAVVGVDLATLPAC